MAARYEQIAAWVNEFGWTTGVELGVFDGQSHFHLLQNCPNLTLVGIDLWGESAPIEGKTKSGERCDCQYCNATRSSRRSKPIASIEQDAVKRSKSEPRSRLVKANTALSADLVEQVDFVFVDGDHSFEGVKADISAWWPKVRYRLVGHDWNMRSVRDAVYECFPDTEIATGDDHLWWVSRG